MAEKLELGATVKEFRIPGTYEEAMPFLAEYRERKIPRRLAAKILTQLNGPSGDILSDDRKLYLSSRRDGEDFIVTVRKVA